MGRNKPIFPLTLSPCTPHPKLEPIQRLDFSIPGSLPWAQLIALIEEMETDDNEDNSTGADPLEAQSQQDRPLVATVLEYLKQRGYVMVSLERLNQRINANLTEAQLGALIDRNPRIFRRAVLKGNKPGLARLVS